MVVKQYFSNDLCKHNFVQKCAKLQDEDAMKKSDLENVHLKNISIKTVIIT